MSHKKRCPICNQSSFCKHQSKIKMMIATIDDKARYWFSTAKYEIKDKSLIMIIEGMEKRAIKHFGQGFIKTMISYDNTTGRELLKYPRK